MIKSVKIKQYRKLKNLTLDFSAGINVLSGTNGTCKTSILHLISNSFQTITSSKINCPWVTDSQCLTVVKAVNNITNPKVESLTRGDKKYNDPSRGIKGNLFSVEYFNRLSLNFRRHNSEKNTRYSVKPNYPIGKKESLPYALVIYLGLSRLLPYGEFKNDDAIFKLKQHLPEEYQKEIASLYYKFTGLTIEYTNSHVQKMGDVKVRSDFESDYEGIDSNTISAGEDNLHIIITALVSLKYYYQSITHNNDIGSILLIDELDATLHPSFQIKLLELFSAFSQEYKIQVVFTTHSMSLLEESFKRKHNVIYLIDNVSSVLPMEEPDIYKIKMNLHQLLRKEMYINCAIPVFTEDEEARVFLEIIFNKFSSDYPDSFARARSFFHLVKASMGADNLCGIFSDSNLLRSTMRSICILDGDRRSQQDLNKCVITLPGEDSPETLAMKHSKYLYDTDDCFWTNPDIMDLGYVKTKYRDDILPDIKSIDDKIEELKTTGKSTKGVLRELNKNVFNKHKPFFELILINWVNVATNREQMEELYRNLRVLFLKVAEFHEINPRIWT